MIMAAGKGTRLGHITESVPKILVGINGKSVLERIIDKCLLHGFNDIIINVHHLAGMVMKEIERLKKPGLRLTVSDESGCLLDTGGGLFKARDFFKAIQSPFLVYNGDILTDLDLDILYRYHVEKKGLATLAVRHRPGNRFYLTGIEGILSGWCNRATGERIITRGAHDNLSEIAFSGIHVIDPLIFNYMNEGVYSLTSVYLKLSGDHEIYTFLEDGGYWFDMGTPESLEKARAFLR